MWYDSYMINLWHDDIRRPPTEALSGLPWVWARTNEVAKGILASNKVYAISMDHDLGLYGYDPDEQDADLRIGDDEETGLALAEWIVENLESIHVPAFFTIHSWNPVGARRMAAVLAAAGLGDRITVKEYERGYSVLS